MKVFFIIVKLEIHMTGAIEDNSKIIFLFLNENISSPWCKKSITPLTFYAKVTMVLMRGHNVCFYEVIMENYPCYPFLSGALKNGGKTYQCTHILVKICFITLTIFLWL